MYFIYFHAYYLINIYRSYLNINIIIIMLFVLVRYIGIKIIKNYNKNECKIK